MKTCVLHYGMPWTDAAALRASLARLPVDGGLSYLATDEKNASRALMAAFGRAEASAPDDSARGRRLLKRFERSLSGHGELAVLSLPSTPSLDAAALAALRDWLRPLVERIHVVAYVAEPVRSLQRQACQALAGGASTLQLDRCYAGYRAHLEPLEQVFGPAALEYRVCEIGRAHV